METLKTQELKRINGGLLAGAVGGGILGFAAGCISGCVATIYYGDKSGKILVKHMYVGTSFGAMCGTVAPI